jgi:hypothetical protein
MANLVKWIESCIPDVEYVTIGAKECGDDPLPNLYTWEEAKKMLDYEFSDGLGSPECHAVYVWGKDRVGFVVQYDGSTSFHWVPRNPIECVPDMPGG